MAYVAKRFTVKGKDVKTLEGWLRSPTLPQAWSLRAKITLASAAGEGPRAIARYLGVSPNTVCYWRRRYREEGLAGLKTRARPGRPPEITPAKERAVIVATMRPPKAGTHWSTRSLARKLGLSHMAVQRIWKRHGLQPHRIETF